MSCSQVECLATEGELNKSTLVEYCVRKILLVVDHTRDLGRVASRATNAYNTQRRCLILDPCLHTGDQLSCQQQARRIDAKVKRQVGDRCCV